MPSLNDIAAHVNRSPARVRQILAEANIPITGGWVSSAHNPVQVVGDRIANRRTPGPRSTHQVHTITVGADPEFEVFDERGAFIPANRLFSGLHTQVGVDGRSDTGELRPAPGNPIEVTENVATLLQQVKSAMPDGWSIGSGAGREVPLGGHIHIGGRGFRPPRKLVEKLDAFIGIPLKQKSNSTVRGFYGRLGDVRRQPHGWEYRTPCSWLAHPDLAKGALTIAWLLSGMTPSRLSNIGDREQLIAAAPPEYRQAVEDFYHTLESVDSIENIHVFRAWGLVSEDVSIPDVTPNNVTPVQVETERDYGMGYIAAASLVSRTRIGRQIRIVGASQIRGTGPTLFIPRGWALRWNGRRIRTETWEYSNTIGVGVGLREERLTPGMRWAVVRKIQRLLLENV